MSYQEKRTLVSIATGIIILVSYCIYTISKYRSEVIGIDDMKFWALHILIFIGIGIVANIIIQIIFHILMSITFAVQEKVHNNQCDDKEIESRIEVEMIEDEMDKLIELKANRIGFLSAGIGFMLSLVALILNYSPVVMLNIIFISFNIGSLLEGFTQLYYYRKGV